MRICSVLLALIALPAVAAPPTSFSAAKRIAVAQVYYDQDQTFYCGCSFDFEARPDLASCGY
ncbi:hypothetical protein [Salinicola halimionae]|uniref:hypothetical protein n=1 Tax=Salinicola halimionae TaxID=1949081 RepID=UPI001CB6FA68|nr:hypothetical protein [Salinicola halimionae]